MYTLFTVTVTITRQKYTKQISKAATLQTCRLFVKYTHHCWVMAVLGDFSDFLQYFQENGNTMGLTMKGDQVGIWKGEAVT
jgi:hypothetical protein